jgi:hypothetical protein
MGAGTNELHVDRGRFFDLRLRHGEDRDRDQEPSVKDRRHARGQTAPRLACIAPLLRGELEHRNEILTP